MAVNPGKSIPLFHRLIGVLLLAHLLMIGAMASSSRLHEWAHPDAGHAEHQCAVTLILSGSCASPSPLLVVLGFVAVFMALVAVGTQKPLSFFVSGRSFERGPPVLA